ncbi:MAG: hypothetical protein IBJ18_12280 [Phycisphaerales bacterium]|nr:hypothetical protein [Phycisphaerales bacterium]
MPAFSSETWLILLLVAGVTIVCCAYTLSALLRDHERIERLKSDVATLRADYERRISEMNQSSQARKPGEQLTDTGMGDFEIVGEEPTQSHAA